MGFTVLYGLYSTVKPMDVFMSSDNDNKVERILKISLFFKILSADQIECHFYTWMLFNAMDIYSNFQD